MDPQFHNRIDTYKHSIRRRQLNTIFTTQRQLFQHHLKNQQVEQLQLRLSTSQNKTQYIQQMGLYFAGVPQRRWLPVLQQLHYAVPLFQGQHQQWFQLGIMTAISQLFNDQYLCLGLSRIAADIFTDILYMGSSRMNYRILRKMHDLHFIDAVIVLMLSTNQVQYIRLVASYMEQLPKTRNTHYKSCLDYLAQQLVNNHPNNSQFLHCLLYLAFALLLLHEQDSTQLLAPKKQTIQLLLPQLSTKLLNKQLSLQNKLIVLRALGEVCRIGRQEVYEMVYAETGLVGRLWDMLCWENRYEVRLGCARVVSHLLISTKEVHAEVFMGVGFVDRFQECYHVPGNKSHIKTLLLIALSNLLADSPHAPSVIAHPLLPQLLLPEAVSPVPQIRQQALYCLCTLLQQSPLSHFQHILQLDIISVMIHNLKSDGVQCVIEDVLETWKVMIARDGRWGTVLMGRYGVLGVLEEMGDMGEEVEGLVLGFVDWMEGRGDGQEGV